jgi:hypothetical protein
LESGTKATLISTSAAAVKTVRGGGCSEIEHKQRAVEIEE